MFFGCTFIYRFFLDLTHWDLSRCDDLTIFDSHDESSEISSNQSYNINAQDINLSSEDLTFLERSSNNLNDISRIETISNIGDETEKERFYDNFYN